MRMVKFPHSCIRFETSEGRLVVDPGAFSGSAPLEDPDAVLITHVHFDHLDPDAVRDLKARRPDLEIYGPPSLEEFLKGTPFTAVRHGDVIRAAGLEVKVFGEKHAVIHPSLPVIENVGYYFDGIFHPGDSFTVPELPVHTLLAPTAAPWMKLSEGTDYIERVAPQRVHPIHEAILGDDGIAVFDRMLDSLTAPEYVRLAPGEGVDL
ncbi:MBL fold metallo-hydrolase [Actinocorallia populi]|uniref:MBL fold metallo-hydrolase n=1 Tax=Actinocorallia populi TaxID=2079200 RepID=UPI000D08B4E1|nr:MBL fold metallo-hydrolase [Actinocorallia populi]